MKLKITKYKIVESTNNEAIKLIQKHKHTSGLIVSDTQTKGRGTMGKKWVSKKGNIFISIFFKVNFSKIKIQNFLIISAKIVKEALKQYTQKKITIKKPNDLLIENKKISGILQEVIVIKNENFLITGIGINTFIAPNNKKIISTCLKNHTNKTLRNLIIIKNIKNAYEKIINEFENNNFTNIKNRYI
jgi:BirA family biotin operon repressor/biotin-[acetyl-CoA-carboxylase] ligase